jgi:hypothetical protein
VAARSLRSPDVRLTIRFRAGTTFIAIPRERLEGTKEVTMRLMARTAPRMAATACVAGALLAGATAAWAFDPASPSPVGHSPDAVVALFAGAVHGDSTWAYADGATRSTSGDYGRISGLGRGSIEIRRADGVTVTVATSDATCVRNQGLPARFRSLRLGERALVIQEDGSAIVVRAGRPLFRSLFSCGC